MRSKVDHLADAGLIRFTEWFQSSGGVWQTFMVVLAVTVLELSKPSIDPHAFILMAVLTVYSGITQPALAYGNAVSSMKLDEAISKLDDVMRNVNRTLDKVLELEERLIALEESELAALAATSPQTSDERP